MLVPQLGVQQQEQHMPEEGMQQGVGLVPHRVLTLLRGMVLEQQQGPHKQGVPLVQQQEGGTDTDHTPQVGVPLAVLVLLLVHPVGRVLLAVLAGGVPPLHQGKEQEHQ